MLSQIPPKDALDRLLPRKYSLIAGSGLAFPKLSPPNRRHASGEAVQPPSTKRPSYLQHYRELLKAQPVSHVTSFLILHEVTAVVPLPIIFYGLQNSDFKWETVFPKDWLEKGDVRMRKTFKALGLPEIEEGSKAALNAAATYAIVKAAMPLRLVFLGFSGGTSSPCHREMLRAVSLCFSSYNW